MIALVFCFHCFRLALRWPQTDRYYVSFRQTDRGLAETPRCLQRKSVDCCVMEFVRNASNHDGDLAGRYIDLLWRAIPKKGWKNVSQQPRVGNVPGIGALDQ